MGLACRKGPVARPTCQVRQLSELAQRVNSKHPRQTFRVVIKSNLREQLSLLLLQTPTSDEMTSTTTESWYLYVKATDREMQSTPMEQRMAEQTLEEYGAARVVEWSCKG